MYAFSKAFGKKDTSKLVKKVITNKAGKRQTVYVKPDVEEAEEKFTGSPRGGSTTLKPEDVSKSLNSLIKYNKGNWKSSKQAKYLIKELKTGYQTKEAVHGRKVKV